MKITEILTEFAGPANARPVRLSAESQQLPISSRLSCSLFSVASIALPNYDPATLYSFYDQNADIQAAIDDLVDAVVGSGVTVKSASSVDPLGESLAQDEVGHPAGCPEQRERLRQFLLAPNDRITEDFPYVVGAFFRDVLVVGDGYLEWGRSLNTAWLERMWYASAVDTRVSEKKHVLYQLRGTKYKAFRELGSPEIGIAQNVTGTHDEFEASVDVVLDLCDKAKPPDDGAYIDNWRKLKDKHPLKIEADADKKAPQLTAADKLSARSLPEMLHAKLPDPENTYYGRPSFLGAAADHTLISEITTYNVAFFRNNTIPPIAIIVKGSDLEDDSLQYISDTIARQGGRANTHKTLVIEIDAETSVEFEKLHAEQLTEGAFIQLRDQSGARIFAALRVPISRAYPAKADSAGALQEANRIFLSGVVSSFQRWLAAIFNRVFREHMGITDWVIEFNMPAAEDMQSRSQIWVQLMTKGVLSINEVRRELGMRPVEGGDENYVTIPGTGTVVISLLRLFAERALRNQTRSDIQPSGGAQTPRHGLNPLLKPADGGDNG